jgi:hypothetical protein
MENADTKYVFFHISIGMAATSAEQTIIMKAWSNWLSVVGNIVADPDNPFKPGSKSISTNGVHHCINSLNGYNRSGCGNSQRHPGLDAGTEVSIYEIFEAMP